MLNKYVAGEAVGWRSIVETRFTPSLIEQFSPSRPGYRVASPKFHSYVARIAFPILPFESDFLLAMRDLARRLPADRVSPTDATSTSAFGTASIRQKSASPGVPYKLYLTFNKNEMKKKASREYGIDKTTKQKKKK